MVYVQNHSYIIKLKDWKFRLIGIKNINIMSEQNLDKNIPVLRGVLKTQTDLVLHYQENKKEPHPKSTLKGEVLFHS